jgi:hypothetical protein
MLLRRHRSPLLQASLHSSLALGCSPSDASFQDGGAPLSGPRADAAANPAPTNGSPKRDAGSARTDGPLPAATPAGATEAVRLRFAARVGAEPCHSSGQDCAPLFERIGLDLASGTPIDGQRVYRVEPARETEP